MEHLDEREIEQYALDGSSLRWEQLTRVEEHLKSCNTCKRIFEFLKMFHADLRSLEDKGSARVNEMVSNLFPVSRVIQLRPFRHQVDPATIPTHYAALLAAMSETGIKSRYKTVCTLASEAEQTIARIVYDSQDDLYRLYVLTDDPRKQRYAILSIPELQAEFVTDHRGYANFKGSYGETEWDSMNAILLTMVEEFFLDADNLVALRTGKHLTMGNLELWFDQETLILQQKVMVEENLDHVLVTSNESEQFLLRFQGRRTSIDLPTRPTTLTIRLYA